MDIRYICKKGDQFRVPRYFAARKPLKLEFSSLWRLFARSVFFVSFYLDDGVFEFYIMNK